MKRLLSVILLAVMFLNLLPGCSTQEAYVPTGDALDQGEKPQAPTDPDKDHALSLPWYPMASLNPFSCTDYTNRVLFSLIYQGLFAVDQNYEATPILCKNYNVSADMRTYTIYLEEATFSDGTSITPEDVVASLKASIGSAWYGSRLQHVASIAVYGDAVVLELDTPMYNLPILLDIPIVKASQVEAETPLGSGPYRMDGAKLRRQAGWWCSASLPVSADEIFLVQAESPAKIRDTFEAGGISIVCSDPGDDDYVDFLDDCRPEEEKQQLLGYDVC